MDSLRPSLAQALPPHNAFDPEQDLQNPFRAAALGIANFYRKASETSKKAYSLGYAAGLQDVLEYLQAGLDHSHEVSSKQQSENRMAVTIERVMDYIERRQESLRGETDSGDEDASPHGPASSASASHAIGPAPSQPPMYQTRPQSAVGVNNVRAIGRRSSPRRTFLAAPIDQQSRHSPVPPSSSPVEFPIAAFPFSFDPPLPPPATHARGVDRHASGRKSTRKGKARDRFERSAPPTDTSPSPSTGLTQVPSNTGYSHYTGNQIIADTEVGNNGVNKRRYHSSVLSELNEAAMEPSIPDLERSSKRLAKR